MKRNLNDYNNSLRDVMNLMSITRKYKVVGSANLRTSEFIQDYDIDGMFKTNGNREKILDSLTARFKCIFRDAYKNPALYITDFKAGLDPSYLEDDDRYKLRWNKEDIKNGYKILGNGSKKFFRDCLMENITMKLDMIYLLNGEFVEMAEIYRLNINGEKNYYNANVEKELLEEIDRFTKEKNYYKLLKRRFSLLKLKKDKK